MNRSPSLLHRQASQGESVTPTTPHVTDESLIVRNYGGTSVRVHIRFVNADDEAVFDRTYTLGSGEVVSTSTRLRRGVYRVAATVDYGSADPSDASKTTKQAAAECLIGSAPAETAVVETGNGVISVTEGVV